MTATVTLSIGRAAYVSLQVSAFYLKSKVALSMILWPVEISQAEEIIVRLKLTIIAAMKRRFKPIELIADNGEGGINAGKLRVALKPWIRYCMAYCNPYRLMFSLQ